MERNCKYNRLALPGIVFMCWPFEALKSRVSLRVMQLDIRAETKTLDNVFVLVSPKPTAVDSRRARGPLRAPF